VTIPKEIRKILKSDVIEFAVDKATVTIKPVNSMAGSLSDYGKKYVPLKDVRDTVWDEALRDKVGK